MWGFALDFSQRCALNNEGFGAGLCLVEDEEDGVGRDALPFAEERQEGM